MKRIILASGLLFHFLLLGLQSFALKENYHVQQSDIYEGRIVKKIWLQSYALPQVAISDIVFSQDVPLPKDAKISDPGKIQVVLGMERKRPFIVIRIPAYTAGAHAGLANQVNSFALSIDEQPAEKSRAAARTTYNDVTSSVLSAGTWYKIGVTKTGFYKIDNSFLAGAGLPAGTDVSRIRVYGNGGVMLAENNAVQRPADLVENAIWLTGNTAVFYAVGPTGWVADSVNQQFHHVKNLYCDTAYYFITFDKGPGARIATQSAMAAGNVDVNSYNYYDVHDTDVVNPAGLGKRWYGEQLSSLFGNSHTFSFNAGTTVSNVNCTMSMGATSGAAGSSTTVTINGQNVGSALFLTATSSDDVMALSTNTWQSSVSGQTLNVGVNFSPADGSSTGYLDYIELNGRANLSISGDQASFRDFGSVGTGNIANYHLQGANGSTAVWDVTNPQVPVLMSGSLSGSTYSFTQDAQTLHEFAAMNSLNLYTPKFVGQVINQNLHGAPQTDMIIVSYPDFIDQANRLADYHRSHDHLRVLVTTPQDIYNEFSSGGQDLSAIRDFVRMFYKRAGADEAQMPRYLLLFGGGSYDYKNRIPNNNNFVPVFESAESANDLNSFCSDDFYGFLDDSENIEDATRLNALDIAVGRLPARNTGDAQSLVDKIISYTQPGTLGPWRISATFTACRDDAAGNHMLDADAMAGTVSDTTHDLYNIAKIYQDALQVVSTPAGGRAPAANNAINNSVFKGTLMINYNGHGNTDILSPERILTQDDYNSWNNANMLPFMVTATCDYGQFDHPQFVSAAEHLVIRNGGGAIAMLTTTQAVFAVYNHELNQQYLAAQFYRNSNGKWNTFGEACTIGKNITYARSADIGEIANFRKFSLLGDPALSPDFPEHSIHLDNVKDGVTMEDADSIKALGKYIFNGSVTDQNGNLLNGFNGTVYVSFYDKPRNIQTITSPTINYQMQDNIVYKGKVTVTNGHFSITFIAPKDINYYYGTGKLSVYAENGVTDAAGVDTSLKIGGFSDHPQLSSNPPVVKPYINDSLFLNGGITGNNTSLFVTLYSETGINVSGNNIGHDMTAVLDGNIESPYILNDYYETAPNTYQYGFVSFPLAGLANGRHTITVKAWDVNNNSGEGTVEFTVVDGKVAEIKNLLNYPNPFTNTTRFVFEHNHPEELLETEINIYSISGKPVRTIKQGFTAAGSRTNELTWDGTDNNGARLPSGVYLYRLNISTEKGVRSSAYQKLVIVR
jgi:hypothetical protein